MKKIVFALLPLFFWQAVTLNQKILLHHQKIVQSLLALQFPNQLRKRSNILPH